MGLKLLLQALWWLAEFISLPLQDCCPCFLDTGSHAPSSPQQYVNSFLCFKFLWPLSLPLPSAFLFCWQILNIHRHSVCGDFPHLKITERLWELHGAIGKLSVELNCRATLMSYKLHFSWERHPEYDCCLPCLWHKSREKHLFQQSLISDHAKLS